VTQKCSSFNYFQHALHSVTMWDQRIMEKEGVFYISRNVGNRSVSTKLYDKYSVECELSYFPWKFSREKILSRELSQKSIGRDLGCALVLSLSLENPWGKRGLCESSIIRWFDWYCLQHNYKLYRTSLHENCNLGIIRQVILEILIYNIYIQCVFITSNLINITCIFNNVQQYL